MTSSKARGGHTTSNESRPDVEPQGGTLNTPLTTPRDGLPLAMETVEKTYGPPTQTCGVCRGGEWVEDGVTTIALHHLECPRGKKREAADD